MLPFFIWKFAWIWSQLKIILKNKKTKTWFKKATCEITVEPFVIFYLLVGPSNWMLSRGSCYDITLWPISSIVSRKYKSQMLGRCWHVSWCVCISHILIPCFSCCIVLFYLFYFLFFRADVSGGNSIRSFFQGTVDMLVSFKLSYIL